jgi:phospholipase/lecithinase/hemolysin
MISFVFSSWIINDFTSRYNEQLSSLLYYFSNRLVFKEKFKVIVEFMGVYTAVAARQQNGACVFDRVTI